MAFNLYCNETPSVYDIEDAEEQLKECRCYTVEDLFCCGYARYFWEAVKIRNYFPREYSKEQIEDVIYTLLEEWKQKEGGTKDAGITV